jgi:Ca-activated chloride channel family protein
LLSVVAQNAPVQIDIPEGMECEKVYGYPFDVKGNQVTVRFNDIYANEEKAILLKLRAKKPLSEALHFDCKLGYTSTKDFKQVNDSRQITVKVTSDKALVEKGKDSTVQEMLALFESTEQFDEIMAQVDKGAYDTAKSRGDFALNVLKQKQAQYKSEKLEEQVKKMSSYLTNIDSVKVMQESDKKLFQKSAKSINYEVKKQKKLRN